MAEIRKTWTVGGRTFDCYEDAILYRVKLNQMSLAEEIAKTIGDWDKGRNFNATDKSLAETLIERFNISRKRRPE